MGFGKRSELPWYNFRKSADELPMNYAKKNALPWYGNKKRDTLPFYNFKKNALPWYSTKKESENAALPWYSFRREANTADDFPWYLSNNDERRDMEKNHKRFAGLPRYDFAADLQSNDDGFDAFNQRFG